MRLAAIPCSAGLSTNLGLPRRGAGGVGDPEELESGAVLEAGGRSAGGVLGAAPNGPATAGAAAASASASASSSMTFIFVTAQVRRTTAFGRQLNPKQVHGTTAGMKQTWLQVELHNKTLKWMLASAIKCFQRCPTDQPHEEFT